jgi:ATP-dependent Clp protease adapter protein ClpS
MKTTQLAVVKAPTHTAAHPVETTIPTVTTSTDSTSAIEAICQVVLHNDDHNVADYVVLCLMKVFKHDETLAVKIMMEAHTRGRSIAEVEAESLAVRHRDQLRSLGLSATVEKVG